MQLRRHLTVVQNIITSRDEIVVEQLTVRETIPGREGFVGGRLRFYDGSMLEFIEVLVEEVFILQKTEYTYHFQDRNDKLIFRYDNAPHYPELLTFPHHKHRPDGVESAEPPHLGDILREIDSYLYDK